VTGSVVRNKRNIVVDIKVGYTIKGFVEKNQISHLSIITQKNYQILPKSYRKITKNGNILLRVLQKLYLTKTKKIYLKKNIQKIKKKS
jgi:sulfur carrier protein ThiS